MVEKSVVEIFRRLCLKSEAITTFLISWSGGGGGGVAGTGLVL
jgi:hypothetical protein